MLPLCFPIGYQNKGLGLNFERANYLHVAQGYFALALHRMLSFYRRTLPLVHPIHCLCHAMGSLYQAREAYLSFLRLSLGDLAYILLR